MAVEEIRKGEYVDPDPVESEPGCIRMEPDSVAFQNYLMPRLEGAHDEASAEVFAGMRTGRSFGDAVLDTIESLPESKTKKLRIWIEETRATRIYSWVEFRRDSYLYYGLMLTAGGPRDQVLATEEIGNYSTDDVAPYWEFQGALNRVEKTGRASFNSKQPTWLFEEISMVELDDEEEYNVLLRAMNMSLEDGAWKKSGLYDFSAQPPIYAGTLDAYERESMKEAAERVIEDMFAGDEWESTCEVLLAAGSD